jgi:quinol monooxygenase YgiN
VITGRAARRSTSADPLIGKGGPRFRGLSGRAYPADVDDSGLHVVAVIVAKSGSTSTVGEALTDMAAATRGEPGCLSYELYESQSSPGTFVTVETWRDQAALDSHLTSPHVAQALALAADHLSAPPAVHPLTSRG